MNKYTIIPSSLEFKSAPFVDQEISLSLTQQSQEITEYDRSQSISLAQLYDDERQACTIFRPTFKVNYLYSNTYIGTTRYVPFVNNLYYTDPIVSKSNNIWKGFPQYYEFDFFRPDISDQHIRYQAKSAYTYNWTYYISYAHKNNYDKDLYYNLNGTSLNWKALEGIPFYINNALQNGSNVIAFQCVAPHGLTVGEYVELSFNYNGIKLFQVYSLGNGQFGSNINVFNIYNVGYTGATFANKVTGTFKRVIDPEIILETKSKYYVREHKILTNVGDCVMTKNAFEKNVFNEEKKFEYSSITPNNISRVSQKTSSNSYNITVNYDLNINNLLDNQKRPISELFLTIINKGYTGYFNKPTNGVGLKQGWEFNLTKTSNFWWDATNLNSNTNILTSSYTLTSGVTKTFYYNQNLMSGDTIDGDFCEWNNFEQIERVISKYQHKITYNYNWFSLSSTIQDPNNSYGYFYRPHNEIPIREFSNYIEESDNEDLLDLPDYAYYSTLNTSFRWRDLYSYGFISNDGVGLDYPFLNNCHYPFINTIFRITPENYNIPSDYGTTTNPNDIDNYQGGKVPANIDIISQPLVDGCDALGVIFAQATKET